MKLRSASKKTKSPSKPPARKPSTRKSPPKASKQMKKKSRAKRPTIYCGNNKNHTDILSADKIFGTPYKCMQKGFMFGRHHMPVDMTYVDYDQHMPRKIWCGKRLMTEAQLRNRNYDINGTLPECYSYGVGAGRRAKALAEA